MPNIKCKYCLKICKITYKIIKHFSMYKMWQKIVLYIVSCNILHKPNNFSMAKTKTILPLKKSISEEKDLYIDTFDGKNLAGIVEKMSDSNKVIKI